MAELTSEERVLRVLRRQEPDRVPHFEWAVDRKVRAALCHDHFTAQMSRLHNDANILVMGERVIGKGVACEITRTWLETGFEGGRHQQRLDKIQAIEQSLKG